jgi:sarcosine dehydrogenase
MWPLMEVDDLVGASWLPTDGQASPSDITQSLAKGARMHGAKIFEQVRVTGFEMDGRIRIAVKTDKGDIACEKVVNCAASGRARSAPWQASMFHCSRSSTSISSPKRSMASSDAPTIRDPDRRTYFKEEVGGFVIRRLRAEPARLGPPAMCRTTGSSSSSMTTTTISSSMMEQPMERVPALEKPASSR